MNYFRKILRALLEYLNAYEIYVQECRKCGKHYPVEDDIHRCYQCGHTSFDYKIKE